jgi:hypothetical protein
MVLLLGLGLSVVTSVAFPNGAEFSEVVVECLSDCSDPNAVAQCVTAPADDGWRVAVLEGATD